MKKYFEAVSVGAFFFGSEEKTARLIALIRGLPYRWVVLHFFLITICLNFPVMLAIVRIEPYQVFSRLYGENFLTVNSDGNLSLNSGAERMNGFSGIDSAVFPAEFPAEDFNTLMLQNGYGRRIMLPLLAMAFGLVLILQAAFYGSASFCIGLQRMVSVNLSVRDRLGLLLFSSTPPVFLAALFGVWLPTVHILLFYLAVIIIGFQRSKSCPNG
ncbi:MAG: hypothetical protein LBR99_00935 [Treponema sp.]|jgi:hypothetical protein|nr:hypothetical protein [Treponema sp.]